MPDRDRLERVLADIAAMQDRGEAVDATGILAAHPDLGEPLRDALAALELLDLSLVADAAAPHVPERVGPYRVTSRLGSGGMGTVYLAETQSAVAGCEPGECVAIKVVHPHLLERPGFFKRFLREAEAGRAVVHPHVVRTLDADAVRAGGDTVHFLVMEYVEGQTLADLLEDLGVVPETLLREIARQMADGLSAIHDAGLIHRDLKPENALITSDHVVRLMDLGVARPLTGDHALTQEGAFAGSLPYAAPEQFGDGEVTAASDLYSLGVTLYELATGQSPFRRDGFAAVMAAHREYEPPSVREVVPEMSPFLSDVVATLLAKQPSGRFGSAGELATVVGEAERSDWWRERASRRPRETPLPQVPVRRETALHGRDADLALLRESWDAAVAGNGRTVLLEGEAGIGKTRLVDAFLREIGQQDVHVLYGSYPPTGGLGGISDAIVEHFGEHGLEDALAAYLTVTPSLVPSVAAFARHQPAPEGAPPLTTSSVQTVLMHLMRALAAEKPLVWVVDDLHFADEESRGVLLSMARAVGGHRVLLVGTARPGLPDDWLAHAGRLKNLRRHSLGRLGAREVMLLLQEAFKSDRLAERLGVRIALKSDGIPLFVFEMIRGLREGQFLTQLPDGSWAETKVVEEIEVPSAVRGLISARLRGLSDEHRAVLDTAAVHGFEFDPDVVARVLGRTRLAVLQDLASIERGSGVVQGGAGRCRFDHHQLQEVLYDSLPPDLRCEYHVAIARALENRAGVAEVEPDDVAGALSVELCEHYLKGSRGQSALRYLAPGRVHLARVHRHVQLVALLDRALAVPDLLAGSERARNLLLLSRTLEPLGRYAGQEGCAREAVRLAQESGDEHLLRRAVTSLGIAFLCTSRHEEAAAAFQRANDLARAMGDKKAEAGAAGDLGNVFYFRGRLAEARDLHERSLALHREIGNRDGEARATGNLGLLALSLGQLSEARDYTERCLALAREIGDLRIDASATTNLGNTFKAQGRLPEAQECGQRALALSREIGDRYGETTATGLLGGVRFSQGRISEAQNLHEGQLALSRETGYRRGEAIALVNLGNDRLALGERMRARASFDAAVALSREIGARHPESYGLRGLGRLADEEEDRPEALRLVEDSLALFREVGSGVGVADALILLGDLRRRGGDLDAARAALDEALTLCREHGRTGPSALALAQLACVSGGETEAALAAVGASNDSREFRWLLFQATGDRAHLAAAKRLLDEHLALNPPEYHDAMRSKVRVNREILAAWKEQFGEDGDESETRVG